MTGFLKKIFKIKIFFYLGLLIFLGSCFRFSAAQQSPAEGITISPPIADLSLNPGQESEQKIQVTNPTENLLELYPSVMNFNASGESGEPGFYPASDEASKFSLAHWITLSQPKIAVAPMQVVEFKYKINVPLDAEPGGHYGVVFLATKPPEADAAASQVSIASQVGSLVLVRTPGDITEEGSLEEFSAPWFFFKPPVSFAAFIKNNGNIHWKPKGEITIRDWQGKEKARIDINPKRGNVLPDSRRKFEEKWDAPATPFWKIPVGKFSADLRVVYGQNDKTLGSKIYFWIIPWWLIIGVAVLFLALIIFCIRRWRKKRKLAAEKNKPPSNMSPPPSQQSNPSMGSNSNSQAPPRRYI
jgi:hypothetical protein